jgi:5-methylcytosine-specific restriction endonuclease McrA
MNDHKRALEAQHQKMTKLCGESSCLVCGDSPCEPCHIRHRGMGGANSGWDIEDIVPLCRQCHNVFDARNGASKGQVERTRVVRYIVTARAREWQLANGRY